ncbi:MAG: DNA gyrase inhibitor YacG [Methyloceanibacter sp.]
MKPKRAKSAKGPRCPICGKPAVQDYRPFCSRACADEDLGRWLGGRYVVPGERVAPQGDGDGEAED